jgi:polynucleotide 5'-hydroxyl-kinase GRC3/NOL9
MMQIAWDDAVGRIVMERWRMVLVLGAVDVGKSHFCRLLADTLLQTGRRVALLDTDLGQKIVGTPATVTLGYPDLGVSGGYTPPALLHFVGSTNAAGHFLPVVAGIAALAEPPAPVSRHRHGRDGHARGTLVEVALLVGFLRGGIRVCNRL